MPPEQPRSEPLQIAEETFLIQSHQVLEGGVGVVNINSLLIRGDQPIVVDTGAPVNRSQFLGDVFTLVEPGDVCWIFLTHDDIDHSGNCAALMEACPRARLVTTWLGAQRLAATGAAIPRQRSLWLAEDDVFDIGDRALTLLRPPLYDAPGTRGLLDTSTGVYWAADCFAAITPAPAADVADVDADAWRDGFIRFHQWNSPWFEGVDGGWWQRAISRFQARQLTAIASCHGPVIGASHVPAALDLLRELPTLPVAAAPGQEVLDRLLASLPLDVV